MCSSTLASESHPDIFLCCCCSCTRCAFTSSSFTLSTPFSLSLSPSVSDSCRHHLLFVVVVLRILLDFLTAIFTELPCHPARARPALFFFCQRACIDEKAGSRHPRLATCDHPHLFFFVVLYYYSSFFRLCFLFFTRLFFIPFFLCLFVCSLWSRSYPLLCSFVLFFFFPPPFLTPFLTFFFFLFVCLTVVT